MEQNTELIKNAPLFDVHRWSDYPEVNNVVDSLFDEVKALRKSKGKRIVDVSKVKKSLKVIILDLWVAHKLSTNPYRAISKNKSDFRKESRYNRIFLKYDYFVKAINDLHELDYINQKLGIYYKNYKKRTRIKATTKLIEKIESPSFGVVEIIKDKGLVNLINPNPDLVRETIILRKKEQKKKINIDYVDTITTNQMRDNLVLINKKIQSTRIALSITQELYYEMLELLKGKVDSESTIDFTKNELHRVFNNNSFEQGGRFYGGWWQNIPREYRKYITINYKPTVELDYSGHHLRILYSIENLEPPVDPYDVHGFDRDDLKNACLIMINASSEGEAIKAIKQENISVPNKIVKAVQDKHSSISKYFFSGEGNKLMYLDSILAEKVMLSMLERGATVLPIHDSFIVRNSYQDELQNVMENEFKKIFKSNALLKPKVTVLEELSALNKQNNKDNLAFVTTDLEELYKNISWESTIWGY